MRVPPQPANDHLAAMLIAVAFVAFLVIGLAVAVSWLSALLIVVIVVGSVPVVLARWRRQA